MQVEPSIASCRAQCCSDELEGLSCASASTREVVDVSLFVETSHGRPARLELTLLCELADPLARDPEALRGLAGRKLHAFGYAACGRPKAAAKRGVFR